MARVVAKQIGCFIIPPKMAIDLLCSRKELKCNFFEYV
jgi:hypothetical protein